MWEGIINDVYVDDTIFSGKDEKAFETCDKTKAFTKSGE